MIMDKTILVVLTGSVNTSQTDHYLLLQEEAALKRLTEAEPYP